MPQSQTITRPYKLEAIADEVYPLVARSNLTFNHKDLAKLGYGRIYEIIRDKGRLPQVIGKAGKSNDVSEKFRDLGNREFKRKSHKEALRLYTKAICIAHSEGKEIALAYANRSAALYALQEYNDSISDIDRALCSGNYPDSTKWMLYERRGRCNMALLLHSKASEDFELAKTHLMNVASELEHTASLISKIDRLIEDNEKKPDQLQTSPRDSITLSHEPSSYIQCASSAVEIGYSPEFGRHVIAMTDISPGDVLAIEKPYASVSGSSDDGNFICYHCKKKCFSIVPCMSCDEAKFCSDACRHLSWEDYHSIECDILPTMIEIDSPVSDRLDVMPLALRILLIASKCGKDLITLIKDESKNTPTASEQLGCVDGKYLSDDYTSIRHLSSNFESRSSKNVITLAIYATCIVHVLKEGSGFFNNVDTSAFGYEDSFASLCIASGMKLQHLAAADLLLKYLMISDLNSFNLAETAFSAGMHLPDHRKFGSAIYSFHGLFNHSCDPNVSHFTFRNDCSFVTAIQPIRRGQQLFKDYSYIFYTNVFDERQKELKDQYHFTCKCVACVERWPTVLELLFTSDNPIIRGPAVRATLEGIARFEELKPAFRQGQTDEIFEFCRQFMPLVLENVKLPWYQYFFLEGLVLNHMIKKAVPSRSGSPQDSSD